MAATVEKRNSQQVNKINPTIMDFLSVMRTADVWGEVG
jgi:hypothetical protein